MIRAFLLSADAALLDLVDRGWWRATTRTSTSMVLLLPSLVNCASWRTCRSLACRAAFISAISSRKMVPVSACSNFPTRVVAAPQEKRAVPIVGELLAQLGDLGDELHFFDRALDRRLQRNFTEPFRIVRLDHIVSCAQAHGLDVVAACSRPDSMMTCRSFLAARSARNVSRPFMPGIITSSSTSSGGSPCLTAATISSPRE